MVRVVRKVPRELTLLLCDVRGVSDARLVSLETGAVPEAIGDSDAFWLKEPLSEPTGVGEIAGESLSTMDGVGAVDRDARGDNDAPFEAEVLEEPHEDGE